MIPDKELKKQFKEETKAHPDTYFATSVLKKEGFKRDTCKNCKTVFWSQHPKSLCGDASCRGGFSFFDNNPAQHSLSYVEVWKKFKQHFEKSGYTAISRFPVIARWNPTTDFTIASIAAFQPYVVSGEAKPPAEKLVIPQFCLRFGDVDNVGITMSHLTGFVMIGQHQFVEPKDWNQDQAFSEILSWLTEGLGLPKDEITFHEDAWAGGGNFGPCMEFFSRGVELGNQVYMMFEQDDTAKSGRKELSLKVLDMGMGMERNAWFSQGTATIYDATFPFVIQKLLEKTKVVYDEQFMKKYVPFGAFLNLDEIEDVQPAWLDVAKKMGVDVAVLKEKLGPMTAIYAIAEHARSLLLAIADGGLPSNVGGAYNLRVILRRALSFIEKYSWNISLADVCEWHAEELKDLFPELRDALPDVQKILAVEEKKFFDGRKRNTQLIAQVLRKGLPSIDEIITYYDSNGISPDEFVSEAKKTGLDIIIPDNFYALVAEKHEASEKKVNTLATKKEKKFSLDSIPSTTALYFDHYDYVAFKAHVLKIIIDADSSLIVLDRSAFYPTSGGQVHDIGFLNGEKVIEVFKQAAPDGNHIIHRFAGKTSLRLGDEVAGKIDFERRLQLAQHHTATHILTGACRRVLGNHVWQAGAAKTMKKSRLDISHFAQLTDEEIAQIEALANTIVDENRPIDKRFLTRDVAEAEFGFRLYQGGAVPGDRLRIVNIQGFDVEACGGTHLDVTGDVGHIRILKTSKLQDGVVRIEFVAGKAANLAGDDSSNLVGELCDLLSCSKEQIPGRVNELFSKWKLVKKGKLEKFVLESLEESDAKDVVFEAASSIKTQPEHLVKTIKRFLDDMKKKVK